MWGEVQGRLAWLWEGRFGGPARMEDDSSLRSEGHGYWGGQTRANYGLSGEHLIGDGAKFTVQLA